MLYLGIYLLEVAPTGRDPPVSLMAAASRPFSLSSQAWSQAASLHVPGTTCLASRARAVARFLEEDAFGHLPPSKQLG